MNWAERVAQRQWLVQPIGSTPTRPWRTAVRHAGAADLAEIRRTCVHEAGHATLARIIGSGVQSVAIRARLESGRLAVLGGAITVERIVPLHLVVLAGGFAASIRMGFNRIVSAADAADDFESIAAPIWRGARRFSVDEACRRASVLLDVYGAWNAVLSLADELEALGRLEGAEAVRIIDEHTSGVVLTPEQQVA